MMRDTEQSGEAAFFRSLNALVAPLVKAGLLAPGVLPTGLIALEVEGRLTGTLYTVPLVATRIGEILLVGTLRGGRSEWIRNAAASPSVRYWNNGQRREGSAWVIAGGIQSTAPESAPPYASALAEMLRPWVGSGWAFALLLPAPGVR
jgi:hypothetical protein